MKKITIERERSLTTIALRVVDAPVPNFILNSKIWSVKSGEKTEEIFFDKNDVLITLSGKGLKFKSLEYFMFSLRQYNNNDCSLLYTNGHVNFSFESLIKFFCLKSKYDFRLASTIEEDLKSLKNVHMSTHYPSINIEKKSTIRLYAEQLYRRFSDKKYRIYNGYKINNENEPIIKSIHFDRSRREFNVTFSQAFIELMESNSIRYKHIDLKSYVLIGSVHTKNIYRYFDTKYNQIKVKRSTLIKQCGINPNQTEKTLNYKIRRYLSKLVDENVIAVVSYNTKGKYKVDPLITVRIIPKKERSLAIDNDNKRYNGNYIFTN